MLRCFASMEEFDSDRLSETRECIPSFGVMTGRDQARILYFDQSTRREESMKSNWKHQKDAITTDQKNLTDDPRIHEEDKQDFQASEKDKGFIPGQNKEKKSREDGKS